MRCLGHVFPRRTSRASIAFVNILSSIAGGWCLFAKPVVRGSACTRLVQVLSIIASGCFWCTGPVVRDSAFAGRAGRVNVLISSALLVFLFEALLVTMLLLIHVRVVGTCYTDGVADIIVAGMIETGIAPSSVAYWKICPFRAESSIRSGKEKDEGEESWLSSRRNFAAPSHFAGRTSHSKRCDVATEIGRQGVSPGARGFFNLNTNESKDTQE